MLKSQLIVLISLKLEVTRGSNEDVISSWISAVARCLIKPLSVWCFNCSSQRVKSNMNDLWFTLNGRDFSLHGLIGRDWRLLAGLVSALWKRQQSTNRKPRYYNNVRSFCNSNKCSLSRHLPDHYHMFLRYMFCEKFKDFCPLSGPHTDPIPKLSLCGLVNTTFFSN